MLHAIKGTVAHISEHYVVVDSGGLSFAIQTATPNAFILGTQAEIISHMHWNQEQGPTLFGFANELERTTFQLIIGCSGIGPKIALAILADIGATNFLTAINTANEKSLTAVSGIGLKKAEQIIVQLKHKVAQLLASGIELGDAEALTQWNTISQVLQSLNYSRQEIASTIKYLNEQPTSAAMSFDGLMRHALSFLAKKQ